MKVLGIETSCDETAGAIIEGVSPTRPVKILSNVVASSEQMHIKTGGIVPEMASREQVKAILPVIQESIKSIKGIESIGGTKSIEAIAVTVGPGLVGSLLVGVETAKTLAYVWDKPLIPVNHLAAHLYANFVGEIQNDKVQTSNQIKSSKSKLPQFPAIGLVASGGHTDLVLMEGHGKLRWLGGTRDDAAGECFDKCSRLLNLGYPGGPAIELAASKFKTQNVKLKAFSLPRPMLKSNDYDFSFSGLKTAVAREVLKVPGVSEVSNNLAFEIQEAIVEVLVAKVMRAVDEFRPKSVLLGGGVAANSRLRELMGEKLKDESLKLFIPPVELCTDNAVYIAAAAYYNQSPTPWDNFQVDPGLEIAQYIR